MSRIVALLAFISFTALARTVFAGDPITRLSHGVDSGEAQLEFQPGGLGYLPSLLHQINLPVDSLEIAAFDPVKGVVLYTLSTAQTNKPRFVARDVECAGCPGYSADVTLTVTTVFPKPDGDPFLPVGGSQPLTIDHRTPLAQRWGGWYINGTHGGQRHMGNAVAANPNHPLDLEALTLKPEVDRYLAPTSDIVALMTLEHQTRMINLITRVSRIYRANRKDAAAIDELVTYMLFADEARFTEPIKGVSTFTGSFARRGPLDSRSRSLREFDFRTRMFRYPLSYIIYSDSFDALTASARDLIYPRLYGVLSGKNTDPKFAGISREDRRAVFEILRETKPNVPAYWQD